MTFTTISGSKYEIDLDSNRIRRLFGIKDPTPRQGIDGEWRQYLSITEIKVGDPIIVVWKVLLDRVQSTVISVVKEIDSLQN